MNFNLRPVVTARAEALLHAAQHEETLPRADLSSHSRYGPSSCCEAGRGPSGGKAT